MESIFGAYSGQNSILERTMENSVEHHMEEEQREIQHGGTHKAERGAKCSLRHDRNENGQRVTNGSKRSVLHTGPYSTNSARPGHFILSTNFFKMRQNGPSSSARNSMGPSLLPVQMSAIP